MRTNSQNTCIKVKFASPPPLRQTSADSAVRVQSLSRCCPDFPGKPVRCLSVVCPDSVRILEKTLSDSFAAFLLCRAIEQLRNDVTNYYVIVSFYGLNQIFSINPNHVTINITEQETSRESSKTNLFAKEKIMQAKTAIVDKFKTTSSKRKESVASRVSANPVQFCEIIYHRCK